MGPQKGKLQSSNNASIFIDLEQAVIVSGRVAHFVWGDNFLAKPLIFMANLIF